jgi:HPt (histidine-containing phosphotransfer) domain-containing protein
MADTPTYTQQLTRTVEALNHNLEAARDEAPRLINALVDTLREKGFSEIADQLHAFKDVLATGDAASIGQAMQNLGKLTADVVDKAEFGTAQNLRDLAETLTRIGDEHAGERTVSVAE